MAVTDYMMQDGMPVEVTKRSDGDWTQQHYQTLRDSIVIDGVAYSRQRLREILRERHVLATENAKLRERLRRNTVHLQRRTAALARLIARKGPVLS